MTQYRYECPACGRAFAAPNPGILAYNAAKHRAKCDRPRAPVGRPTRLAIDVMARIDAEHSAGRSLREIGAGLERDGVATAHGGKRWYASTIRRVLQRARA